MQITEMLICVSALVELAAFIVSYCDTRADTTGRSARRAVESILNADVLPDDTARHVALWGFADEIGATVADGFDPTWTPAQAY